jgi:phosphonate transport system permease protein
MTEKMKKESKVSSWLHGTKFYKDCSAFSERVHFKTVTVDLSEKQDGSETRSIRKKRPVDAIVMLSIVGVILALSFVFLPYPSRFSIKWNEFGSKIGELFIPKHPLTANWEMWWSFCWEQLVDYFPVTFDVCFLGTLLGAILSVPVYYLCARNVVHNPWIYQSVRVFNDFLRTLPMLIVCLFFTSVFGVGSNIGAVLAVGLFTLGIMYQMMYEYLETLEMSPFEAIRASGGNNLQCVNLGLHPEMKPMFLGYFIYTLEINIRASVILSKAGLQGYTFQLVDYLEQGLYDYALALLLPLFIVVCALQFISSLLLRHVR